MGGLSPFVNLPFCLGNPPQPYTHLPDNCLRRGCTWTHLDGVKETAGKKANQSSAGVWRGPGRGGVIWSTPFHNPDSPQVKVTAFCPIFMSNTTHKSKDKVHWVLLRWCNYRIQLVCTCIQMEDWKKASISKSSHTELSTTFSLRSSGPSTMQPTI